MEWDIPEPEIDIDQKAVDFYNFVRENYDFVAIAVESIFQFRGKARHWRRCLRMFVNDKEYCYPYLTTANLPYIFALQAMVYANLSGLQFHKDSAIYHALEQTPGVTLKDPDEGGYCAWEKTGDFRELQFRFIDHKRYGSEGKESIRACVDMIKDGRAHTIYEDTLMFRSSDTGWCNPQGKKRRPYLLDIAKQEMPDIEPNV